MAIVDYLSFSFMPAWRVFPDHEQREGWLQFLFGLPIRLRVKEGGWSGFTNRADLVVSGECGNDLPVGLMAWGGDSQKGRVYVSLSGAGCAQVRSWEDRKLRIATLPSVKISRLDLAVDFLEGEHSVEQAVELYRAGRFADGRGRPPSHSLAGDWLTEGSPKGRTLYVGRRQNGKMLRVYEKGKQLGDKLSKWVRWELELRAIDRVIPLGALTDPAGYFAGGFKVLGELVASVAQSIDTFRREVEITLEHLVEHARQSYGRLVSVLLDVEGGDYLAVVRRLKRAGSPRRLAKGVLLPDPYTPPIARAVVPVPF